MLVTLWRFYDRGTDGNECRPESYHLTEKAAKDQVTKKGQWSMMYGVDSVPAVRVGKKYYLLKSTQPTEVS